MESAQIERILSTPELPTLPAVAIRVIELARQPEVALSEIARVIENDPATSAKVLRLVNSSYYGLSKRCGSIQQSIAFLGLQTVKGLVLGFSLARSIGNCDDKDVSFNFLDYWRRSLYSAAAAREIALRTRRCDPDEAFVTALIQDIGMVVLWRAFGDRYLQVVDVARGEHQRLRESERKSLQVDHAEIGSALIERWRFPESICAAVRNHHSSADATQPNAALAQTVALANEAAEVLRRGGRGVAGELARDTAIIRYRRHAEEWFAMRQGPAMLLLQTITHLADELSKAFNLDTGGKPDIAALLKQAKQLKAEQRLPDPERGATTLIQEPSVVDLVTGLPDRHAFQRELDTAFLTNHTNSAIGLLLVGPDGVRAMTDMYGPATSDSVVTAVGAMTQDVVGRQGQLFRFLNTEIIAIIPNTSMAEVCRLAERVRKCVAESPLQIEGANGIRAVPLSVTVGVSLFESEVLLRSSTGVDSAPQLMRAAMFALATGRTQGRNRVVFFRREMQSHAS